MVEELTPSRRCRHVHEYATCTDDLSVENGGIKGRQGGGSGGRCEMTRKHGQNWKWHVKKRAHKGQCGREEWRVREAIAGLRDAHREGRYS